MMQRRDAPASADRQPLPDRMPPMLATLGELPHDDRDWAFEMKWDGVRAIVRADRGRVTVLSRNDRDVTVSYPELPQLGETLGSAQLLLDGEIVSFDERGRPSFGILQQRMHVGTAGQARTLAAAAPAVLLLFDVLHLDGRSLLDLLYWQRREILEELELNGPSWQTPAAFDGAGPRAVAASRAQGLEGVMAKRRSSRYFPGRRSPDWVKVKNIRTQELVIGGWSVGQGRRAGTIGSLLLGLPADGALRYAGQVGTGFTGAILDDLSRRLARLERKTSPFDPPVPRADARDARWVTPRLVGEVAFTEWTADGRLRHPSWRGLRPDKSAGEVVREDSEASLSTEVRCA
jgi:bifunctional non-homologous end joining protein LigD